MNRESLPTVDLRRAPLEAAPRFSAQRDEAVHQAFDAALEASPSIHGFRRMDGSAALHSTALRLACDAERLLAEFRCADEHAWGTMYERDEPLWREEVVELFLAASAGECDPADYFEFEISPLGTLFDARVFNPHGDRRDMTVDTSWNCEGLLWRVDRLPERQDWRVRIAIPWRGLGFAEPPETLRANFYRVERPLGGEDEFSGWSPTATSPPDFHRPAHFGLLRLFD